MSIFFEHIFIFFIILFKIVLNVKGISSSSIHNETFLVTGGYRPMKQSITKYMASIREKHPQTFYGVGHFCSGVIISTNAILTASHCTLDHENKNLMVVVGSSRRLSEKPHAQIIDVLQVVRHPHFVLIKDINGETVFNDLAILKLKKPINIDNIDTATATINLSPIRDNDQCTLASWGYLYENGPTPDEIVYTDLVVISDAKCKIVYNDKSEEQFCAGSPEDLERDSCQGDSGAPLFCNERLTGIVSHGRTCGAQNVGGIYTDVASHLSFIKTNTEMKNRALERGMTNGCAAKRYLFNILLTMKLVSAIVYKLFIYIEQY